MTGSTPSPVPPPIWSRQPVDLPGVQVRQARLAGVRLWLVRWQATLHPAWPAWLDPAELDRLARLPTPIGRRRFAAAHAAWHLLPQGPHTSAAHTDELALLAVADRPVGVDAELDRPRERWPRIARQAWPTDPPTSWPDFVSRWVAAEAALKAGSRPAASFQWRSGGHVMCLALGSWPREAAAIAHRDEQPVMT